MSCMVLFRSFRRGGIPISHLLLSRCSHSAETVRSVRNCQEPNQIEDDESGDTDTEASGTTSQRLTLDVCLLRLRCVTVMNDTGSLDVGVQNVAMAQGPVSYPRGEHHTLQ
jgi:hypothetical protein